MPIPTYGAAPLSTTFLGVRILQIISMICIVGMAANFIDMIVRTGREPLKEFVGTLSVTCIATLYTLLSTAFYWSHAHLGLLVMAASDGLLLIAFIVVAVCVGKPISYLNCYSISSSSSSDDGDVTLASAYAFTTSLANNLNQTGANGVLAWSGLTKSNCLLSKTMWGLSIALCVLFTTSCVLLPTLWMKQRKAEAGGAPKAVAEA